MDYSTSDRFTSPYGSSGPHSPPDIWWWLPYLPAVSSSTDFSPAPDGSLSSPYFRHRMGCCTRTIAYRSGWHLCILPRRR